MYVDGTSALQMLEPVFDVIEGGGNVPAGEVIEFVADNGTKIADITTHSVNAANGAAAEVGEVVDIAAGASAGTATGAGIFSMEVGAAGVAIAPALGILAGIGLYNLAPEFWTNVSNALVDAGKTVGGKVFGYVDKNGVTSFDEETIEIFKNAFLEAQIFLPTYTPPEYQETGSVTITSRTTPEELLAHVLAINPRSIDISAVRGDIATFINTYYTSDKVCVISTQTHQDAFDGWASIVINISVNDYTSITLGSSMRSHCLDIKGRGLANQPIVASETRITETNPTIFEGDNIADRVGFYSSINATIERTKTQEGAILPGEDPFPLTYPTWTPYEFPEPLPAYMPDVYPVALPTPSITQDPSQEGANETAPQQDSLVNLLYDNAPSNVPEVTPDPDPYSPPASEPTPPEPEPAPDPIDPNPSPVPSGATISLPTLDTTRASKMFTVYNPTDAQVDALGGFLWTNSIIEQIKKMWQNPLDGIISFHKVYCSPTVGSSKHIILGYIDSEVSAAEVTSQFADVDCGTIHIPEKLHNATDYAPFTSLHCYLPFIGMVELDTDECMNADLHIKYRIDVYTGTCVALLYLKRDVDMPNEQIVYTFSGNASQKLPLTASDFSGAVGALLGLAGAGVAVASGGSLGVAAGALGAAHSLTSEMVHIQHSGGLSANAGILSPRIPYIILSRQYGYDANAYNSFYGYPANKTVYIGNCTGYIKCKEVMFKGSCTEEEMNEITAILKDGVYV